jgi:hypothetical protein
MRIRTRIALIAVAFAASGCSLFATPATVDPNVAFCDALDDYAVAVANFNRLSDENTINEYKSAAQAYRTAMAGVAGAAVDMREAEVAELQSATDELLNTINNLPQDVPISEIQDELRGQVADTAAARLQLGVARCGEPAAAPVATGASVVPAPS